MKDKIELFWSVHDHEILVGFGTAGWLTTTIWSVAVTPAALRRIEKKEKELGRKLTVLEVIKTCGTCFLAPAGLGLVATISIFAGVKRANKKTAVFASAYSLTENLLRDYKDKVVEVIGEEKEKAIEEEVKKKHEEEIREQPSVCIFSDQPIQAYDSITKQKFTLESVEDYKAAINNINADMVCDNYSTVDDYCYELGIPMIESGNDLKWVAYSKEELLKPTFEYSADRNGRPLLIVNVSRPPVYL